MAVPESVEEELQRALSATAVASRGAAGAQTRGMLGRLHVELVAGRSVATGVYARSPLKFILPKKLAAVGVDAVWVYSLSYGGGIVAGDKIDFEVDIGAGCTAVLTTQASTKVYHSHEGIGAQQVLEATVGSGALLAVLPDPLVCFARSSFVQSQTFHLARDASLVLVDWLTCGRRAFGEVWAFDMYESSNRVFLDGASPLLLDKVRLEQGHGPSVAERMHGFHVVGLLIIYGGRTTELQAAVEAGVQSLARAFLGNRSTRAAKQAAPMASGSSEEKNPGQPLVASCSRIGDQGEGLVVRMAATSTEEAYSFLQKQLAPIAHILGAMPYRNTL